MNSLESMILCDSTKIQEIKRPSNKYMNNKWNECKQKYIFGDYHMHGLDDSIRWNQGTKSVCTPVHSHNLNCCDHHP